MLTTKGAYSVADAMAQAPPLTPSRDRDKQQRQAGPPRKVSPSKAHGKHGSQQHQRVSGQPNHPCVAVEPDQRPSDAVAALPLDHVARASTCTRSPGRGATSFAMPRP